MVLDGFHGVGSSVLDVAATAGTGEHCQSPKVGHEYFVYAQRSDGASRPGARDLTTNLCSGIRPIEDAGADLAYAREVKQGAAPTGFVSGSISVVQRTLAGKAVGSMASPPAIPVTVSHGDATDTTVTERGEFRVAGRGAGTYRVSVHVPDAFYSDTPAMTVTLRDPRSCAHVGVALHDNGRVAGRVVDSAGRPVGGLTLELGLGGSGQGRRTVTDRDGRYALARMPSGRFVLSVPAGPSRATGGRPMRVFHPGVDTLAAATRVTLAAGEERDLADFRIPDRQKYVPVSGVVFDADGRPAEGARVYLKGVGDDDRIVSEPVAADFVGRFVIAALAGTDYLLFAERTRPEGRSSRVDSTDQLRLAVVEGLKPVRLTLERRY